MCRTGVSLRAGGCAGADLQGLAAVCPGGVLAGGGWFFPGGGANNFFSKSPTRMYKEAVDPVSARLVDKAIFRAILWWV